MDCSVLSFSFASPSFLDYLCFADFCDLSIFRDFANFNNICDFPNSVSFVFVILVVLMI